MAKKKKPEGWEPRPTYLAAWRNHKGLGQAEAAAASGFDTSMISKIETGSVTSYNARLLEALADLYGCRRGDLLDTDPKTAADEAARLRSALLAYGVDRGHLDQVLGIVGTFVTDEKSEETRPRDDNQRANPRHEQEPLA